MRNQSVERDLKRLYECAKERREWLQLASARRLWRKRILTVLSGVLALVSAGAVTAVLVRHLGEDLGQVFAICSATVSGTISLVVASYFSDDDTALMLSAATKYLLLRERISEAISGSESEMAVTLEKLKNEYLLLDEQFARVLMASDGWERSRAISYSSLAANVPFATLADSQECQRGRSVERHAFVTEDRLKELETALDERRNNLDSSLQRVKREEAALLVESELRILSRLMEALKFEGGCGSQAFADWLLTPAGQEVAAQLPELAELADSVFRIEEPSRNQPSQSGTT